jgi:hypothetical protein
MNALPSTKCQEFDLKWGVDQVRSSERRPADTIVHCCQKGWSSRVIWRIWATLAAVGTDDRQKREKCLKLAIVPYVFRYGLLETCALLSNA